MSFLWFFVQENIFQTGKQFKSGTFYIYFTFLYQKQKDEPLLIQKLEKCLHLNISLNINKESRIKYFII